MTIKQAAEKYGVSTQAIYQRLKKEHIQIYTITDKVTKDITAEGEVILSKLFDPENKPIKPTKSGLVDELTNQLKTSREEVARLTERVRALEADVSRLTEDKDSLTRALEKAQDLHQMTLDRLLPGKGGTMTFKEWLASRKKKS